MYRRLTLTVTFLSLAVMVTAAGECYFPNGNLARHDRPCYTNGGTSHCCGPNAVCLTNGLCLAVDAPYTLSRGSCTDKECGPSCPSECATLLPDSGAMIMHFRGSGSDATYCCGSVAVSHHRVACATVKNQTQEPFTINDGTFMAGVAALAHYADTSNSNATASNRTALIDPKNDSRNDSKLVAVGAGIGAPLGVIAIAAVVWAIVERRKRKRIAPAPAVPVISDSRTSNGAELYGYSQKSAMRLNGSGEVHRSY